MTTEDEADVYRTNTEDYTIVDTFEEDFATSVLVLSKTIDNLPLTTAVLTTQPCYSEVT